MKYIKLYESFDDFEEVWEEGELENPELEIDLTGVELGKGGPHFNVLDRVLCLYPYGGNINVAGKVGYIIDYNGINYLVYFINDIHGHHRKDACNIPDGHGWFVNPLYLQKY